MRTKQYSRVSSAQESLLFSFALAGFGLYVVLLLCIPLLTVLFTSLRQRDFLGGTLATWSLQGWRDLLSTTTAIVALRSACYAGITTAICMAIGLPLGI